MNILDHSPTIEAINAWLLYPFRFKNFTVSLKDDSGEMKTVFGFIDYTFSRYALAIHGMKRIDLDMSTPFDKESIDSKSLIVIDTNGKPYLLTLI